MSAVINTILGNVITYITNSVTLYSPIYKNAWQTGTGINAAEQIIARVEPSNVADSRYFDGSRAGTLNIAFYAKSGNQVTASNALDLIIDLLDVSASIEITGALTILCKGVTVPYYHSQDDAKKYIFACSLKLDYFAAA